MRIKKANTYIFAVDLCPKWCPFLEEDAIKGVVFKSSDITNN